MVFDAIKLLQFFEFFNHNFSTIINTWKVKREAFLYFLFVKEHLPAYGNSASPIDDLLLFIDPNND